MSAKSIKKSSSATRLTNSGTTHPTQKISTSSSQTASRSGRSSTTWITRSRRSGG